MNTPPPSRARAAPVVENAGEIVDCRQAGFSELPALGPAPWASLEDRRDGACRPLYATELDLARLRGAARHLATLTPVAGGALDALANYTFGPGFTFGVAAESASVPLRDAARALLEEFVDDNDLAGFLDRELHHRSREDGEAFVQLVAAPPGRVTLRFLEPDQVTEPANPRPLEDWLGIGAEFTSSWSFGVHTRADTPGRALGYHVVYDSQGRDWDYLPAAHVEHIRRNVPRNAKRGVSDFLPIQADLLQEAKLRRNTVEGAALQAAIAWILQTPAGPRESAVDQYRYAKSGEADSTRVTQIRQYGPGTILEPTAGLEYKPGPMGAERNSQFLLVAQYVLRAIGLRWNMPEYLISGDAGNANYASTLAAESPFVKAREADQQFYKRHFQSLCWKMLRLAWEAGRFDRFAIPWERLVALLVVQIGTPAVASRDPLVLAQTQALQLQAGTLSRRTAAAQAGLDYDLERRQRAEESADNP